MAQRLKEVLQELENNVSKSEVIEKLKSAYEFVKPLIETAWKVISFIGKSLFKFGGWISGLFNRKKAEENTDLLYDNSTVLEEEIDTINIDNSEDNLSFSLSSPKKAKFSGNPINSAPLLAANSICSSASAKFASILEVLVICSAATKKSVKTKLLKN